MNEHDKILNPAREVVWEHIFEVFIEHVIESDDYPCQTTMCELAGELKSLVEWAVFRLEELEK